MNDIVSIIEEPIGGHNYGRKATEESQTADGSLSGTPQPLSTEAWQAADLMREGGWQVVDVSAGGGHTGYREAGMTVHRGVLHPDEFVDHEVLLAMVEEQMGFPIDDIRSVYAREGSGGPIPAALRELAVALDARVLALSRDGANIEALREVLGLNKNALAAAMRRAEARESA